MVQILHGGQDVLAAFAGKAEDRMDDHFQFPFTEVPHAFFKAGERISPPDITGGFLMDSLKAKLHPYRFLAVQSFPEDPVPPAPDSPAGVPMDTAATRGCSKASVKIFSRYSTGA